MLSIREEHQLEIDAGGDTWAVIFTANDEYLVGGTTKGVQVWRVEDGIRVATMKVKGAVECIAASQDGRWIAAGSATGHLFVWDAETHNQLFADCTRSSSTIFGVDFSPDSTRLISAAGHSTAPIWDIVSRRKVRILEHDDGPVIAAKYSPQGDRIATATEESIRVWNSDDGRLLLDVAVQAVKGLRNIPWSNNHIFVRTKRNTIKQINAATGSTISELSVPGAQWPCIFLLQHGRFIACSGEKAITIWDVVTHVQIGLIPHTDNISSFAFSSVDSLLAIAPLGSKRVTVKELFQSVSVRCMLCLRPIFATSQSLQELELGIDTGALNKWKRGRLADAEVLLSVEIPRSENRHHALASRALVRARLGQWDAALADATEVHVAFPVDT